jgi:thiol-disulfide isomerase/thioredoxin
MNPITRRLILASAGVGAALVGGAVAWRRFTPPPMSPVAQAFWLHDFRDPNGQPLDLAPWRGKPLLVNFWATWCPPCIKELPEINQFYGEAKARKIGQVAMVGGKDKTRIRNATPARFRDLLLDLARTVNTKQAEAA